LAESQFEGGARVTYRQQLWEVALDQHGYVTARDATELGIPRIELVKLGHRGQLIRAGHGIYRFPSLPEDEAGPYMLATLWAGGDGVLSHDTALALHDLCDINPATTHVCVNAATHPRAPRRAGGELYTVHREQLDETELTWWEGVRIVTPTKAIIQGIDSGVSTALLHQALHQGRARGQIAAGDGDHLGEKLENRSQ
jgi:predicted transcriptional regulator of viral defense system